MGSTPTLGAFLLLLLVLFLLGLSNCQPRLTNNIRQPPSHITVTVWYELWGLFVNLVDKQAFFFYLSTPLSTPGSTIVRQRVICSSHPSKTPCLLLPVSVWSSPRTVPYSCMLANRYLLVIGQECQKLCTVSTGNRCRLAECCFECPCPILLTTCILKSYTSSHLPRTVYLKPGCPPFRPKDFLPLFDNPVDI